MYILPHPQRHPPPRPPVHSPWLPLSAFQANAVDEATAGMVNRHLLFLAEATHPTERNEPTNSALTSSRPPPLAPLRPQPRPKPLPVAKLRVDNSASVASCYPVCFADLSMNCRPHLDKT